MTVPNFTAGQVLTADELDTLRSALGMTIPDFTAGQVLTAAELNELVTVANTAIFYGVATGGTALPTPPAGYAGLSFTTDGTLTVTTGGLFDVLLVAAGGQGGNYSAPGAGGAGGVMIVTAYLAAGTYTVDIGAANAAHNSMAFGTTIGTQNTGLSVAGGGSGATVGFTATGYPGGSGGGGFTAPQGAVGVVLQGNNGAIGGGGATAAGSGATGGAGLTTSFTGVSATYGVGGSYTGQATGTAGANNTGNGGNGGTTAGGLGGTGYAAVRWEV
jgi:hypothetical protein